MQIKLEDYVVNKNGKQIAYLSTIIKGDGTTPVVQTMADFTPVGYNDDGSPIPDSDSDKLIGEAQQKFMAAAIKEQKRITEENGLDPNTVNAGDNK